LLQFDDHVTLQSILAGATCADELWKSPAHMTRMDRESEVLLGDVIVSPIDEPISDIDKRFRGLFEVTCCQVQLLFVSSYWCRESIGIKKKRAVYLSKQVTDSILSPVSTKKAKKKLTNGRSE